MATHRHTDEVPYNTAFSADDDTPPRPPPPTHKAPALVGCVVRLRRLDVLLARPDDLVGLCALVDRHPHLGRFTPRASREWAWRCAARTHPPPNSACVTCTATPPPVNFPLRIYSPASIIAWYVELVVAMTPRYILQLEGPNGEVFLMFIYEPCVDGRHHLLVAGEDAGFLVQNTLVESHLQAGHLLLCNGMLLRPCKQTKFRLPPLPPPEPAENAHLQLSPEDAAAVIAAARLALPMPTVNGVRIVHDTATNRLLAEVSKGSLVAVGCSCLRNSLPFPHRLTPAPASCPGPRLAHHPVNRVAGSSQCLHGALHAKRWGSSPLALSFTSSSLEERGEMHSPTLVSSSP